MKMKSIVVVICLTGLLGGRIAGLAADPAQASADDQLRKIEHDWGESYVKRDPSFAQRLVADDFVFIGPDGNMANKVEYIKGITGATVFTAFELENLKVRVYEDAAVVTGVAAITAKTGEKDESGKYAFADTFVKQNGDWKAVSSQTTAVKNPSNP